MSKVLTFGQGHQDHMEVELLPPFVSFGIDYDDPDDGWQMGYADLDREQVAELHAVLGEWLDAKAVQA